MKKCGAILMLAGLLLLRLEALAGMVTNRPAGTHEPIQVFHDGPWKGQNAAVQYPLYDAVVSSNLDVTVYPKDKGVRVGPSIGFGRGVSFYYIEKSGEICWLSPPTIWGGPPPQLQPEQISYTGQTTNGVEFGVTLRFKPNGLAASGWLKNPRGGEDAHLMRIFIAWPRTHDIPAETEQAERIKLLQNSLLRVRDGDNTPQQHVFHVSTCPYSQPFKPRGLTDWLENSGPWGARKFTVRLKPPGAGILRTWEYSGRCPWEGFDQYLLVQSVLGKKTASATLTLTIE